MVEEAGSKGCAGSSLAVVIHQRSSRAKFSPRPRNFSAQVTPWNRRSYLCSVERPEELMKLRPWSQGQLQLGRISIFLRATFRALTVVGLPILVLAPFAAKDAAAPHYQHPATVSLRPWPSQLGAGTTLRSGAYLTSANGRYRLEMQANGDLVLSEEGHVLWASHTPRRPRRGRHHAKGRQLRHLPATAGTLELADEPARQGRLLPLPPDQRQRRARLAGASDALGDAHVELEEQNLAVPSAVREALRRSSMFAAAENVARIA